MFEQHLGLFLGEIENFDIPEQEPMELNQVVHSKQDIWMRMK